MGCSSCGRSCDCAVEAQIGDIIARRSNGGWTPWDGVLCRILGIQEREGRLKYKIEPEDPTQDPELTEYCRKEECWVRADFWE